MREMCHYLACKSPSLVSHASEVSMTVASSALAPLVLSVCIITIFTIFQTPMSFCQNSVCWRWGSCLFKLPVVILGWNVYPVILKQLEPIALPVPFWNLLLIFFSFHIPSLFQVWSLLFMQSVVMLDASCQHFVQTMTAAPLCLLIIKVTV